MPTNITGFQMMRRKKVEKERFLDVSEEANESIEKQLNEKEVLDVNAMTVEEVRAKLTELDVYFQQNTGEAKLKAKLEGVLNGTN